MLYEKLTIPINLPRPYNNEINIEYPHIALIKQLLNSSKTNETSIINLFNNYFLEKVSLKIKNIVENWILIFIKNIVPIILKSSDKDQGLYQLLRFIDNIIFNFSYLEELINKKFTYDNLSNILTFSGYMTNLISQDKKLLDILDPDYAMRLNGNITFYQSTFDKIDSNIYDEESLLDALRKNHRFLKFQILFALINNDIDIQRASNEFSLLAQATLNKTLEIAEKKIIKKYDFKCDQYCIIAYGRFGTMTMTSNSDLDLVFIHNDIEQNSKKNHRSIYIDLFRMVINILSTKTKEGMLYEVDTKLKPSGKYGPIASTFSNFKEYQENKTYSWEKIALKKIRLVSKKNKLTSDVSSLIKNLQSIPILSKQVAAEVKLMRTDNKKPNSNVALKSSTPSKWFETKYNAGGQRDIEFLKFFYLDPSINKNTHEYDKQILFLNKMEKMFFKLDQIMNICYLDEKQDHLPLKAISILNSETNKKDLGSLKSSINLGKIEIYNTLNEIIERLEKDS